jgi:hypothetical protein
VGAHGHLNKAIGRRRGSGLSGATGGMVCARFIITPRALFGIKAHILTTPDLLASLPRVQSSTAGNRFTASGTDKTNTSLYSNNDL